MVLLAGSRGGVNLNPPALAGEESRLEFFVFDASYVERLRAGDAHIEGHFVNYFSELIRLKLRSRLNSKEAIEDVRQETFMRVLALLRGDSGLRQPDRLGSFVNSVCNHVLQEHYRSKKRIEASIDEETESTGSPEPVRTRLLEAKDTERVVRKILNELPERDRRLLQSVLLEERDKDEVCAGVRHQPRISKSAAAPRKAFIQIVLCQPNGVASEAMQPLKAYRSPDRFADLYGNRKVSS